MRFAVHGFGPFLLQCGETTARLVAKTIQHLPQVLCFLQSSVLAIKLLLLELLGVVDLDFMGSYREAKLIAIDKEANDNIGQRDGFGKAKRFAREPLDPRAQRQMLPFHLLRVAFARRRSVGSQMPGVRPPVIGEEAVNPEGCQQGLELEEYLILAPATDIRQHLAGPMLKGLPQPAGLLLAADRAPPLVDLCGLHAANAHLYVTWA
jgi:hypothetical protein